VPDDAAAATSQADGNQNQQQAATQADAGKPDQASGTEPVQVKDLPQWAQDHITSLRNEAAKHRTKAQELETRDMTELQKAQAAATRHENTAKDWQTKYETLLTENAVRDAADVAGARNARAVYRLIRDDLEVADDGTVSNLDAAIKAAKKDYPEMFRVVDGGADGGRGRQDGTTQQTDMNRIIRRQAGYAV
jgi:hypothetical protein